MFSLDAYVVERFVGCDGCIVMESNTYFQFSLRRWIRVLSFVEPDDGGEPPPL
jgi:hypothetical protein